MKKSNVAPMTIELLRTDLPKLKTGSECELVTMEQQYHEARKIQKLEAKASIHSANSYGINPSSPVQKKASAIVVIVILQQDCETETRPERVHNGQTTRLRQSGR